MSVAVILGSAFGAEALADLHVTPQIIETRWGPQELHRVAGQDAWLVFRHGRPHRLLPNQINYRAQAQALRDVGCEALLITSSVGVLDATVPLFVPLIVDDLIMLENRLPDGSACTMFPEPTPGQGHLLLRDGLFSTALTQQVAQLAAAAGHPTAPEPVVFTYIQGPRTKTSAENRALPGLGAQVNSMTLGPEVVLANELEIPCAGLVVGHKHSGSGGARGPASAEEIAASLVDSRRATEAIVTRFVRHAEPVPFANHVYRFEEE